MDPSGSPSLMSIEKRSLVPLSWASNVRTIGIGESSEVGRSLAHSFAMDELSHYLLDGDDMAGYSDEHKWKLHVDIMTYLVAAHCYRGIVTSLGPDHESVALW
jgi:hypothetical protein